MEGCRFITFPNPKTQLQKCLRWIKACGRPHEQLNVNRINKNKVICSKHFVGGNGPTEMFPDPLPVDGQVVTPTRPPPKRRCFGIKQESKGVMKKEPEIDQGEIFVATPIHDTSCQTDFYVDAQEARLEALMLENEKLRTEVAQKNDEFNQLTIKFQNHCDTQQPFTADGVRKREKKIKKLFVYYTGISYVNFLFLLSFLFPNTNEKINYGRNDVKTLSNENALFLLLSRLRHDFGLKDLAMRFNISLQSAGIVFNKLLEHMYFKYGQVSIWPHRDVIISKMPTLYKKEFPSTLIIIDGTEFKTQVPKALGLQSQMYSDYKSSTTFKALIGCDPRGSVIFISELFTGSISDKLICEESGFYALLKDLMEHGYIKRGDGVMADKGFTIHDEISKIGMVLNIPPFSSCSSQMSASDTHLTQKIAKHRVHIERLIAKVKTYKLLSHRIPASLFKQANKIWTVCAMLTLHQDIFLKDK